MLMSKACGAERAMIDALQASLRVAGSGLAAQSARLRVDFGEYLANAQSTGTTPGADPYRRKTITFESDLRQGRAGRIPRRGEGRRRPTRPIFRTEQDPGNPAADASGVVKTPNVNVITEMSDMREANRSYEANLQVIKQSRDLIAMTLDLLKS